MHFWFAPTTPFDLGVSRVLFFTGVLLAYFWVDFSAWGTVSHAYWMPLPVFDILRLRPAGPTTLDVLQLIWRLSLLTSAVGLHTRLSMWVAFALGFYLLGLPHNFGHTFHFDATLVIALGILACSRAGDAWSLDATFRPQPRAVSGEYTWPVRAVWVAMALVFLAAGIAKLRYGGLEWIFSSNLSIVLNRAAYHVSDADPITTVGLWAARHEWMSKAIAAATVVVELGFTAALFSTRARLILVPAEIAMLVGIRVLMGPTFGGFLVLNVFWVPWSVVIDSLAVRARVKTDAAAAAETRDVSTSL